MIAQEEKNQNDALNELLAKRRSKKNALRDMVENLGEKKAQVDEFFTKKMDAIEDKEKQELAKIEPDIAAERKKYLKAINTRLEKKRADELE